MIQQHTKYWKKVLRQFYHFVMSGKVIGQVNCYRDLLHSTTVSWAWENFQRVRPRWPHIVKCCLHGLGTTYTFVKGIFFYVTGKTLIVSGGYFMNTF